MRGAGPPGPRRFLALFLGLVVAAEVALAQVVYGTSGFRAYLALCARSAALLLRGLCVDALCEGTVLRLGDTSVEVVRGCDALQPAALFVCGVLAFPGRARAKAAAIGLGLALVFALNALRIASLAFCAARLPRVYEPAHLALWPMILVLAVLAGWAVFAARCADGRGFR